MTRKKKYLPIKVWVENNGDSVWFEDPHSEKYTEYIRKDVVLSEQKKLIEDVTIMVMDKVEEHLKENQCILLGRKGS